MCRPGDSLNSTSEKKEKQEKKNRSSGDERSTNAAETEVGCSVSLFSDAKRLIRDGEALSFDNHKKRNRESNRLMCITACNCVMFGTVSVRRKFQNKTCGAYVILCSNQNHHVLLKREWP